MICDNCLCLYEECDNIAKIKEPAMTIQAEKSARGQSPEGPIFLAENRQKQLIQLFLSLKGNPQELLSEMVNRTENADSLYDHLIFCLLQSRGGAARIHDDAPDEAIKNEVDLRMLFFEAIVSAQNLAASKRRALGDIAITRSL
jgi:hypothetical protein